jgi:hypothetical protein
MYQQQSHNVFQTIINDTGSNEYIWMVGNDDYMRKLNKSDPDGPEILNWTTGKYAFTCEHRVESGIEYLYVIDHDRQLDALIKYYANNGTEVTRWDINDYSGNGNGLAWNGSRWFIADSADDYIYQVDPADPTTYERSFAYSGIGDCEGLAWDGSYLWAVDSVTDMVYQLDIYGNIQLNWTAPENPRGIAYDSTSGHLWIATYYPNQLYEYYTNGTMIDSCSPPGDQIHGLSYSSD